MNNEQCRKFVIAYNEWLSSRSTQKDYTIRDVAEFTDIFYKSNVADYDYLEHYTSIENKDIEDLTIDEILTKLTFYVRGENFSDDFLKSRIQNGTIDKLMRCLDERTK